MTTLQTSQWSDYYHGNWPTAIGGPISVKAGEGLSFTDPRYLDWLARAAAVGQYATAYYALHTGRPADQARRAASIIGQQPAMYDVERWPAESGSPAGIATLGEVCTAVDTYRGVGGVMHVIYLPRAQWENMGQPSLDPLRLRGLRLINANYNAGSDVPGSPAWHSYGGMSVWAVQYRPTHNIAVGSAADLISVWRTGAGAPAPIPAPGEGHGPAGPYRVIQVQAGDSMARIAARYHMTLLQLERLNPHAGHPAGHFDLIWPGDHLTVFA